MRVVGFGDFQGLKGPVHQERRNLQIAKMKKIFPNFKESDIMSENNCFRAMSPDDMPLIGQLKGHPGVFINTGQGGKGLTNGLGCGDLLAKIISNDMLSPTEEKAKTYCDPIRFGV